MAEHTVEVRHFIHPGDYEDTYVAVCSCRRWSSKHYVEEGHAEDAGTAHAVRGDQHNRAIAQFQHSNRVSLTTQAAYYQKMADDPTVPDREREQWAMLAEECRERHAPPSDEGQEGLF